MYITRLEPNLLNNFRCFALVQLLMILINLHVHSSRGTLPGDSTLAFVVCLLCTGLLLIYLTIPWLQVHLGAVYLPAALIFNVTFSIVALNFFLSTPLSTHVGGGEERAWQSFFYLFVPLVLVAWQYRFRSVVAFCAFMAILDLITVGITDPDFAAIHETYSRLLFIRSFTFLAVGYMIAIIMRQLRQERQALQDANQRLERFVATQEQLTISRERNRMARELHDTLAHTLSGLAIQLEAVSSLWAREPDHAQTLLQQSLKITRDGLTETRLAIQSLRATPLEDLGLVTALRNYAESATERNGLQLNLELPGNWQSLPPEIEQCVYRIVQEALENIIRHSQAKTVWVKLVQAASGFELRIEDDGTGFDTRASVASSHLGLKGMRERAQLIGAEFMIDSHRGAGTKLRLCWREDKQRKGDRQ